MTRHILLVHNDIDDVRQRIIDAVDRPVVDMTVEDICRKTGISKQTFYSRFSSKFDIANWFCAHYEQMFLYEIGRTLSWEDGLGALFGIYETKRDFLCLSAVRTIDDGTETKSRHREILKETIGRYREVQVTRDVVFLIEAYLELEVFLVGEWFRSSLRPDAEAFTQLFIDCIPRKFYDLLCIESVDRGIMQAPSCEANTTSFSRYYPETL